jgi:hypothetical protein
MTQPKPLPAKSRVAARKLVVAVTIRFCMSSPDDRCYTHRLACLRDGAYSIFS